VYQNRTESVSKPNTSRLF